MTNEQLQHLKQIIADAPEGATNIEYLASTRVYYLKKSEDKTGYKFWIQGKNERWHKSGAPTGNIRSLSDMRTIIAQAEEIERLKEELLASFEYETEYDGRMYSFCIHCENSIEEGHRDGCVIKKLMEKSE
uniref:hypothetical protein n=1 Tax=Ningiella ruwaisensis TaxID=2364274 RepID=UPI0010A02C29|nr:hypothetical protein [Ningiella ruwaisensis]